MWQNRCCRAYSLHLKHIVLLHVREWMNDNICVQSVMSPRPYSPELGSLRIDSSHNNNSTWSSVHTNVDVLLLMFIAFPHVCVFSLQRPTGTIRGPTCCAYIIFIVSVVFVCLDIVFKTCESQTFLKGKCRNYAFLLEMLMCKCRLMHSVRPRPNPSAALKVLPSTQSFLFSLKCCHVNGP